MASSQSRKTLVPGPLSPTYGTGSPGNGTGALASWRGRFRGTHITESSSTAEDRDNDLPLALEYSANTASGVMTVYEPGTGVDGDGLTNGEEIAGTYGHVTGPGQFDSDGDSFGDGEEIAVGTGPNSDASVPETATWVDFNYAGTETGSFMQPYNTANEGTTNVPAEGLLRIKAGSTIETLRVIKPMRIEAAGGAAQMGAS